MNEMAACAVCGANRYRPVFSKQGYRFVRCANCHVMHLDPIPSWEELKTHYSSRSKDGNYEVSESPERDELVKETVDFIARQVEPGRRQVRLLDIGCHDGRLLNFARDRLGWECWGIEPNESAVEVARRQHGDRVQCVTIEDFKPPNGMKFDVITATGLVEHLRDPRILFERIADWIVDGGTCIMELPNAASLPARILGRYWPPIAAPEHIWYFGPTHIEALGRKVGLRYVRHAAHWKRLPIRYVYRQLQYFGPELYKLASVFMKILPTRFWSLKASFYGGEMYVVLTKPSNS